MKTFFLIFLLIFSSLSWADSGRSVTLDWDPIPSAKVYEIEFINDKGDLTLFESANVGWKGSLNPGVYKFRIRGKDRRGVAGPWTEPEEIVVKMASVKLITPAANEEMVVSEEQSPSVNFSWTQAPGAKFYLFSIVNDRSETILEKEITDSTMSAVLPVGGQYRWSVVTKNEEGKKSDPISSYITVLSTSATRPKLKMPENPFVRFIEWKIDDYADAVDVIVYLFDEKESQYKIFQQAQSYADKIMPFQNTWPGGKYKVTAYGKKNGKVISQKDEIEFQVIQGDRSPASETKYYIESFLSRQTGAFGHINYIASNVSYEAYSPELNSISRFKALTGTMQAGYGTLLDGDWGVRGNLGLGGIVIDGKNHLISELGVQGFKKQRLAVLSDSRFWLGLSNRGIPETQKSLAGGLAQVEMVNLLGLQTGGDLWYAINGTWGVKAQGLYEMPISAQGGRGKFDSGSLLRLSGFLTYNLNAQEQLHLGYTMSDERYKFSSANSNEPSQIKISGSFINLQLEMGF